MSQIMEVLAALSAASTEAHIAFQKFEKKYDAWMADGSEKKHRASTRAFNAYRKLSAKRDAAFDAYLAVKQQNDNAGK